MAINPAGKALYRWLRDLHFYLGLYLCPFVVLYAVSTILLNHGWPPPRSAPSRSDPRKVEIPEGLEQAAGMDRVREVQKVLKQLGVSGEVDFIRFSPKNRRMTIPVLKPGEETLVHLDLASGGASVEVRRTGLADALVYLHRSPGPHNVAIRGNWVFTQVWRWLADGTVYLLLFLSASGIYLWAVLRAERRIGLILLAAGCLTCGGLVYAITA